MNESLGNGTGGERIARFTGLLTGSGIVCKILLLIFAILAADILGRDSYGYLEYLLEMALIFGVLVDFGLEQTVTRDLAKWKDRFRAVAGAILGYRLVASLLVLVAMELTLSVIDLSVRDRVFWLENTLASVYCVIIFHGALTKALLRSQEQLAAEAGINLADRTFLVVAGIAALWIGGRISVLLGVYIASALLALGLGWRVIFRRIAPCRPQWDLDLAFIWQRTAIPIGLSAACILLLHREDTVMVNILAGDAETGIYKAAYRPFEGLFLFPQMLAVASYPVFSSLYAQGEPIDRLIARFLRLLMYLSVPMAVGGTLIAESFIGQCYPKYAPDGVSVLMLLVWSLPFIFGNFLLGTVLNAIDRQAKNFYASVLAMVSNFVLNIPAILWYGAEGAAAVTILSQGLYLFLLVYYCRDRMEWHTEDLRRGLGMIGATVVMAAILVLFPYAWYWEVMIGAAVYGAGLIVFRGAVREDLDLARSLLGLRSRS
ncbi:MAG TPA: flippase [bacterium]|nr:flippase [bacterium]